MILVCDRYLSERAYAVREMIFKAGYPCVVSEIEEITDYRPLKLIVSFDDVYESVRKTPNDDIFMIVIGEGFVNSALGAKHTYTAEEAVSEIESYIYSVYSITDEKKSAFGFNFTPSLFFSKDFFAINGNVIEPTVSEYMIFKYLIAFASTDNCFTAEKICKFCLSEKSFEKLTNSNIVSVHIANINKKIEAVYRERVIRSHRGRGYYITTIY